MIVATDSDSGLKGIINWLRVRDYGESVKFVAFYIS
jgi:hypothetical protein